jgi:hypothetical protein
MGLTATATVRGHTRMPEHVQEEYRALLEKHGLAFDERHVWD